MTVVIGSGLRKFGAGSLPHPSVKTSSVAVGGA